MRDRGPDQDLAGAAALCETLFQRWDPMFFETVDPMRKRRMEGILRSLRAHVRGPIRVLDLGSGPGTLTGRVLVSFPRSRVVAVDTDPVLLRVGAEALHRFGGRALWVLADLRKRSWTSRLPGRRYDAAVSSLALHWLEEDEIRNLYRSLQPLIRPGGVLINGDFLPSDPTKDPERTDKSYRNSERTRASLRSFRTQWEEWWTAVDEEPSMQRVLRQRRTRMPGEIPPRRTTGPRPPVPLEAHQQALREAGFRETAVTWRDRGMRVLMGVR
jgi:SAM-dependent methyltransferase